MQPGDSGKQPCRCQLFLRQNAQLAGYHVGSSYQGYQRWLQENLGVEK